MTSKGERTILIIDAEQSWLEFYKTILVNNGYVVYTAQSSQMARKLLAENPSVSKDTTLILIDINSFEEDIESIPYLTSSDGANRIVGVVFSTELTPNRARITFKLGATDCISKPYDEDSLLAIVEQMSAEYRITSPNQKTSARKSSAVLIIDDDADWQVSLTKYLPPVDKVGKAATYEEAVTKIDEQAYDLIVCDLRLVDADDRNFQGMDLIRCIREKDKERDTFTQIIVVSAYGTPEHIRESYKAFGIYYYFDKRYLVPSKYRDSIIEALKTE